MDAKDVARPFLEVRRLVKRYQVGEKTIQVLFGVDLDVRKGEMLMIVGRSGAGKSTLLHLMGLLETPTAGDVLLDGEDVGRAAPSRQGRIRNREFGFVFQFYHLLPELTALENVVLPRMIDLGPFRWYVEKDGAFARAADLLERVGLGARLAHKPAQLSGGERQRVAIARALMNRPRLVLCDEPTGNLDEFNAAQILDLLCRLNEEEGQTFVLVTHDREMARAKGHRQVEMVDGKIVRRLVRDPAGEWRDEVAAPVRREREAALPGESGDALLGR